MQGGMEQGGPGEGRGAGRGRGRGRERDHHGARATPGTPWRSREGDSRCLNASLDRISELTPHF